MADILNCRKKTDEQLVKLTLKDQDYLQCLIERYESRLLNYIMRISSISIQEAEDILQEVFIKTYRNLNGFNDKYQFSSWIYRIARNETISAHRKKNSKLKDQALDVGDEILNRIADDFDLEEEIRNKEAHEKIVKILSGINKKYRDVLVLRFFEGKDYKEISFIMKKPPGTIATWINRAKKEFKKELKKQNINL